MRKGNDNEDNPARAEAEEGNMSSALTKADRELLQLLRNADRQKEHDDFYRKSVIEEELDDDCIDCEEAMFMAGYISA